MELDPLIKATLEQVQKITLDGRSTDLNVTLQPRDRDLSELAKTLQDDYNIERINISIKKVNSQPGTRTAFYGSSKDRLLGIELRYMATEDAVMNLADAMSSNLREVRSANPPARRRGSRRSQFDSEVD